MTMALFNFLKSVGVIKLIKSKYRLRLQSNSLLGNLVWQEKQDSF